MAEVFAEFEGGGEALAGQLALAEPQMRETAEVEAVRLPPGIVTVRLFGAVEWAMDCAKLPPGKRPCRISSKSRPSCM